MPSTIATTNLTQAQFDLQLSKLLGQLEGSKPKPYLDTANGLRHATIGIGMNLTVDANRIAVFREMGTAAGPMGDALTAVITNPSNKTTADYLTIENSFLPGHPRPGLMPRVSTYLAVQNCGATSVHVRAKIKALLLIP